MNDDVWLDRHGHHAAFGFLAVLFGGGYIWLGIDNGFWDVTLPLLQALGICVALFGTLVALCVIIGHYDRDY